VVATLAVAVAVKPRRRKRWKKKKKTWALTCSIKQQQHTLVW